jgi:branched-chain amino acid transport system ATP-binding protein
MTVLFVEHDMDMVRDISDWVVVMAQGKIVAEGPPDTVMADQAVIDAYLGAHHDAPLTAEEEQEQLEAGEAELDAELEERTGKPAPKPRKKAAPRAKAAAPRTKKKDTT